MLTSSLLQSPDVAYQMSYVMGVATLVGLEGVGLSGRTQREIRDLFTNPLTLSDFRATVRGLGGSTTIVDNAMTLTTPTRELGSTLQRP